MLETIVETSEVKRTVLRRIEPGLRQGALLASNTSTIPIAQLPTCSRHPSDSAGFTSAIPFGIEDWSR